MCFIFLARFQYHRRKFRMIGRIGIMLCFEAEAEMLEIPFPIFPGHCSVEEISRIKLYAGLVGKNLHGYSGGRFRNFGRKTHLAVVIVQNPCVVVSAFNLFDT